MTWSTSSPVGGEEIPRKTREIVPVTYSLEQSALVQAVPDETSVCAITALMHSQSRGEWEGLPQRVFWSRDVPVCRTVHQRGGMLRRHLQREAAQGFRPPIIPSMAQIFIHSSDSVNIHFSAYKCL